MSRIENDAYYTTQSCADAICQRYARLNPQRILEPSCGAGSFVSAIQKTWPTAALMTCEIQNGIDFLKTTPTDPLFDMTIGNPPYKVAEQFVRHGLAWTRPGGHVIYLLRLSFEATKERLPLFESNPLFARGTLVPRPSFREDGKTDNSEYAAFVWQVGFTGYGFIDRPIIWSKPKATRRHKNADTNSPAIVPT